MLTAVTSSNGGFITWPACSRHSPAVSKTSFIRSSVPGSAQTMRPRLPAASRIWSQAARPEEGNRNCLDAGADGFVSLDLVCAGGGRDNVEFLHAGEGGFDDEFALGGVVLAIVFDRLAAGLLGVTVEQRGVGQFGIARGRVAQRIKQPRIDRPDGEEKLGLDVGALVLGLLVLGVVLAHVLEHLLDCPMAARMVADADQAGGIN